jgi:hypothetical protein
VKRLVVASLLLWSACGRSEAPQVFLVAGEQAEDFRFLEPGKLGIAYRSGTVLMEGDRVHTIARTAAMYLPVKGTLHSIVRIESKNPRLEDAPRAQAVEAILKLTAPPAVSGVIIDYVAAPGERSFYRALLEELRTKIPPSRSLSIAAPVEWCTSDPWIEDLPVDEVIPTVFPESVPPGQDATVKLCRTSLLLNTSAQRPRPDRRLYYIHHRPWDEQAVSELQ